MGIPTNSPLPASRPTTLEGIQLLNDKKITILGDSKTQTGSIEVGGRKFILKVLNNPSGNLNATQLEKVAYHVTMMLLDKGVFSDSDFIGANITEGQTEITKKVNNKVETLTSPMDDTGKAAHKAQFDKLMSVINTVSSASKPILNSSSIQLSVEPNNSNNNVNNKNKNVSNNKNNNVSNQNQINKPAAKKLNVKPKKPYTITNDNGVVWRETCKAITNGTIPKAIIEKSVNDSEEITTQPEMASVPPAQQHKTVITVVQSSTFDEASKMVSRGLRPLVLDMANKVRVCGDPHKANAQEETLARQSTLSANLNRFGTQVPGQYDKDIPVAGGIFAPGVVVFRQGPENNYAEHPDPFQCDVYAMAAFNCTVGHKPIKDGKQVPHGTPDARGGWDVPLDNDGNVDQDTYEKQTMEKIKNMFRTARKNGNDSLLLSAFGCGAFGNLPNVMARMFQTVLNDPEFKGAFKEVIFAIKVVPGSDTDAKNLKAFQDQFPKQPKPVQV
jgi:hypothetical protein